MTALEIDKRSTEMLRDQFGDRAEIVHGDGASMPFDDGTFSSVVCFTMMHHVPTPALQDAIFAEALRVLRPGGLFRGTDSQPSLRFRMLHIGDTMTVLDPGTLPARLDKTGFGAVRVEHEPKQYVAFSGRKPAPAGPAAPPA
ncbi:MAG TPA: class I SAM-dependent methyltransferase [Amycolatopsis sp.]|nr:class I SAM-dependent methyltransferase [Amycolatopsis sp.]